MLDLNGWPVWAALAVVAVTQLAALFKEPLKNAMPTTLQDWFAQRRQQQLQRYLDTSQKRESQEEISTRLLGYLIDDQNAKLDKLLAAQEVFATRLAVIDALIQGVIIDETKCTIANAAGHQRQRPTETGGSLPDAAADGATAATARDA